MGEDGQELDGAMLGFSHSEQVVGTQMYAAQCALVDSQASYNQQQIEVMKGIADWNIAKANALKAVVFMALVWSIPFMVLLLIYFAKEVR